MEIVNMSFYLVKRLISLRNNYILMTMCVFLNMKGMSDFYVYENYIQKLDVVFLYTIVNYNSIIMQCPVELLYSLYGILLFSKNSLVLLRLSGVVSTEVVVFSGTKG